MGLFSRKDKNTSSSQQQETEAPLNLGRPQTRRGETIGEWMRRDMADQMSDEVGERLRGGTLHGLHGGQTIGEWMREEREQAERDARRR